MKKSTLKLIKQCTEEHIVGWYDENTVNHHFKCRCTRLLSKKIKIQTVFLEKQKQGVTGC